MKLITTKPDHLGKRHDLLVAYAVCDLEKILAYVEKLTREEQKIYRGFDSYNLQHYHGRSPISCLEKGSAIMLGIEKCHT